MEKINYLIVFSYFLFLAIFGLVSLDLAGAFSYSDVPFLSAFLLYVLFLFIQKGGSKTSFTLALIFLVIMGFSYIPTGAGRITERIGEWFYLFFLFGLIQSGVSIFHFKKLL